MHILRHQYGLFSSEIHNYCTICACETTVHGTVYILRSFWMLQYVPRYAAVEQHVQEHIIICLITYQSFSLHSRKQCSIGLTSINIILAFRLPCLQLCAQWKVKYSQLVPELAHSPVTMWTRWIVQLCAPLAVIVLSEDSVINRAAVLWVRDLTEGSSGDGQGCEAAIGLDMLLIVIRREPRCVR